MLDQFNFCPSCRSDLRYFQIKVSCENCGFEFYLNPAPTTAMVFYNDSEVLLVERGKEPAKGKWDVPGGFIDLNETAEEGVIREMKEELGVKISPDQIEYLGSLHDVYAETGKPCLWSVYASQLSKDVPLQPADDVAAIKWFSLEEIPSNLAFKGVKWSIELFTRKRKSV